MLGLSRGTVRVVPYQGEWAALFAREAALLRALMGAAAIAFELFSGRCSLVSLLSSATRAPETAMHSSSR